MVISPFQIKNFILRIISGCPLRRILFQGLFPLL